MEQLGKNISTDRLAGLDTNRDTPVELDRANFAIALRDLALPVDFEDWDGLSDYEVLGLVCAHYPRYSESIVIIWKLYSEGQNEI